jgi:hypothetical protein
VRAMTGLPALARQPSHDQFLSKTSSKASPLVTEVRADFGCGLRELRVKFFLFSVVDLAELTMGAPLFDYNFTTITPILYTRIPLKSSIKDLLKAAITIAFGRKSIENEDRGEGTFFRKS